MRKKAYKSKNAPIVTISTYCEVQDIEFNPLLRQIIEQ